MIILVFTDSYTAWSQETLERIGQYDSCASLSQTHRFRWDRRKCAEKNAFICERGITLLYDVTPPISPPYRYVHHHHRHTDTYTTITAIQIRTPPSPPYRYVHHHRPSKTTNWSTIATNQSQPMHQCDNRISPLTNIATFINHHLFSYNHYCHHFHVCDHVDPLRRNAPDNRGKSQTRLLAFVCNDVPKRCVS